MSDSKPSERQRDAATIELLRNLREKILKSNISSARVAAYHLSWLQEDGFAILSEALFGNYSRNAKKAAAYGLRNMKGRMKNISIEALEQGLKHQDRTTKAVCLKSLQLMRGEITGKEKTKPGSRGASRRRIQSTSGNSRDRDQLHNKKPSRR